ncbi:MAG: rod shape-determining protein MreC [Xanthomonadaceae bacterium]|nr:rod shape-determining protein MreC [Xanthomonadaceae bacterium]
MIQPGAPAPKLSEAAAGSLPLLACIALSAVLMVADHRGELSPRIRATLSSAVEPLWRLAALPSTLWRWGDTHLARQQALVEETVALRRELQLRDAQLARLEAVAQENARLRELLGGKAGYRLSVRMAGIVDVDLDPWRQRVRLDLGGADGVEVGQAMIDAGGMLGQVVEVSPWGATALLVTDASHAVPVQVVRTGLRLVAQGTGHSDALRVPNIPRSADIREGDLLVTSGIGGRFPAGFAVGRVLAIAVDESGLFLEATAAPAARIDRGREVLLVMHGAPEAAVGPPEVAP